VPESDVLVLPIQRPSKSDQAILVIDFVSHNATLLEQGSVGRLLVVPVPGRRLLLAASQRDLRSLGMPDGRLLRPVAELLPPTLTDAPQPSQYGGTSLPLLKDLARETRIEGIGVYEGPRPAGAEPGPRAFRTRETVYVTVGATDRPLVLVLSSNEPVSWSISSGAKARIQHILLSGARESTVVGIRGVEVTRMGRAYAYQLGSSGYAQLDRDVRLYTGRSIERFQGAYTGERFSIGLVDASETKGGIYKCRDDKGQMFYGETPCETLGMQQVGIMEVPVSPPPNQREKGTLTRSSRSRQIRPERGERVIRCGGDIIICDPSDTVICGGRRIPCE
jgi:hypothetical protein